MSPNEVAIANDVEKMLTKCSEKEVLEGKENATISNSEPTMKDFLNSKKKDDNTSNSSSSESSSKDQYPSAKPSHDHPILFEDEDDSDDDEEEEVEIAPFGSASEEAAAKKYLFRDADAEVHGLVGDDDDVRMSEDDDDEHPGWNDDDDDEEEESNIINNNTRPFASFNFALAPPSAPQQPGSTPSKSFPEVTTRVTEKGDTVLEWVSEQSDGEKLRRKTTCTYYGRKGRLSDPSGLYYRWGITAARGQPLPAALARQFNPYVNATSLRFTMPSVFQMFSKMELEEEEEEEEEPLEN